MELLIIIFEVKYRSPESEVCMAYGWYVLDR